MFVVIGGYGRVGYFLAHELERRGHEVAVIDHDATVFHETEGDIRGAKILGEVFDRRTLETAGIRRADRYIAVTKGDNGNIVSARIAKEHYGVPVVAARIYDPRRAAVYLELGVATVSAVDWAVARFLDLVDPLRPSEGPEGE